MAENSVQQVEVHSEVTGKTVFGMEGIKNPTPLWATWIFRTEFVLNKALLYYLSATSLVPASHLKEVILFVTTVDLAVWGMGRLVGVKKESFETA